MDDSSGSRGWLLRDDATTVELAASCSLGRAPANQIVLADDKVSRKTERSSTRAIPADRLPVVTGHWFSECKQLLESHGGSINKYLGDGFFAYGLDAVVSAEQMSRALVESKRMQSAAEPRFRVVLHHGFVSMGGGASMGEDSLAGPEVNFVFRMEKLAAGLGRSFLLSEGAAGRLGSLAPAADAGRHPLPGFEGEFQFFQF